MTIAVPDNEVIETMPKREATALNKKITALSTKVSDQAFELLTLIEQAYTGNIHIALGYKSWTEWFSENVVIEIEDKQQRKMLAELMSGKGMSQRAIAASLGVTQPTVSNDLRESGDKNLSPVVGLDGKTYKRKEPEPEATSEVEESADDNEDEPQTKRRPLPAQVKIGVETLTFTLGFLLTQTEDDRFPKSASKFHAAHWDTLVAADAMLHEIMDKLAVAAE